MPRDHTVLVGGDWTDGFLVGRAAAIQDWRFRKELHDPEFKLLCKRLYHRNWARQYRAANPERVRAVAQLWREANRKKRRVQDCKRRLAKRLAANLTCKCVECGAVRQLIDGRRPSRFCGNRCRSRWHAQRRRLTGEGRRRMDLEEVVLVILARHPWSTAAEILAHDPTLNARSLGTKLYVWAKSGAIQKRGGRPCRYAAGVST